jgi:hypothetical protein
LVRSSLNLSDAGADPTKWRVSESTPSTSTPGVCNGAAVIISNADTTLKLQMEKEDGTWRFVAVEALMPDSCAADASHR